MPILQLKLVKVNCKYSFLKKNTIAVAVFDWVFVIAQFTSKYGQWKSLLVKLGGCQAINLHFNIWIWS